MTSSPSDDALFAACGAEVAGLHRFFVGWMTGAVARDAATYARFTGAVADGFALISPGGTVTEREALIAELEAAHGQRAAFDIWIEDCRCRFTAGDLCLITYEEWQQTGETKTGRLSTALFRRRAAAPNGVEWLHVHETWLPGAAPE